MKRSSKLTKKQKRAGKRKLLIPSAEIQELMQPITREDFEEIIAKALPPRASDPKEVELPAK